MIHGIRDARFEETTINDDIDLATGFVTPPGPSTTFQELVSSGRLRLLPGEEPELMVALQMAYGTQDNIHAVLLANRKRILEILELIAAEKGRAR